MTSLDFDGDGKKDLVVTNTNSDSVSLLLGKDNGAFQAAPSIVVGNDPIVVLAADLNRDGKKDIVIANNGDSNVSMLLQV